MTSKLLALLLISLTMLPLLEAQTTINDNLSTDGTTRNYRLRIPPAASTGDLLPLVINMHGFAGSASQQESYSEMNAVADTANFFVAYPNGNFVFLFLRGWNADLAASGANDVLFISDLIDELVANYPIDPARVYATGFSNGGGMSVALACTLSEKIKAIAPVGAAVSPALGPLCTPINPLPICQMHGDADPIVPYGGGAGLVPAQLVVSSFAKLGMCSGPPTFVNLPDTDPGDGSTVTLAYAEDCGPLGNDYRFYRINGGGHDWPGAALANQDINANVEIWKFFRETTTLALNRNTQSGTLSRRNTLPTSDLYTGPASELKIVPTRVSSGGTVSILSEIATDALISIVAADGRLFVADKNVGPANSIRLPQLSAGLYYLIATDETGLRKSAPIFIE